LKIWILNHVALKPNESGITRHYDISKVLEQQGHDITIFASSFLAYMFKWRDPNRKNYQENVNGVLFEWLWTFPYRGNGVRRVINMISYFFMSIFRGLKKKEKPDAIVGSSVHLFACLAGYYLSKWKKATYIVEIRDLWPRTLIDFGSMSERHPAAIMFGAIEKFVYKRADRIIVTLPGAIDYISSFGIDKSKIYYIPNGINLEREQELSEKPSHSDEINKIKEKHGKVAMYVGAHGMANSLETIVESAAYIPSEQVAYVFVGEGPEKPKLKAMAKEFDHVYFFDSIPKHEVLSTLSMADVLVVSMLNTPLYKYGISLNKLNDYLLVGKPVLFAGNVLNNIIDNANAGITVEPENAEAMANGINELLNLSTEDKERIKESSYKYLVENHDIKKLANKFLDICQLNTNTVEKRGIES